jgi:predicted ferric reductase
MTDEPLLWYLNRSTGFVILALFTITAALGVLSLGSKAGKRVPSFVTQAMHRNIALLSMAMLLAHAVTAVVDTFVDIRWWQVIVPWWGSTYLPFWLGLGTLALDLFVIVTVTSLLRARMSHSLWRAIHYLSYVGWLAALVHGIGIGTDVRAATPWAYAIVGASVAVVLAAGVFRLGRVATGRDVAGVSS